MKKIKFVFYKDKWRELTTRKSGKKTKEKDSTRIENVVRYKGRFRALSADLLETLKIKYN